MGKVENDKGDKALKKEQENEAEKIKKKHEGGKSRARALKNNSEKSKSKTKTKTMEEKVKCEYAHITHRIASNVRNLQKKIVQNVTFHFFRFNLYLYL